MSTHLLLSSSVFSNFHKLTRAQTHLLTLQSYTLGSVQWQGSSTRHNPPLPTPPLHTPRPTSTSRNQHKGKRQQERKKRVEHLLPICACAGCLSEGHGG